MDLYAQWRGPVPASTAEPTSTPEPTPEPTVEPTATPAPTATPKPVTTPVPVFSAKSNYRVMFRVWFSYLRRQMIGLYK